MDSIPDHKDPHAARESSIFARPLVSLTRICCRSPVAVLALGFLLAILAVYGASEKLGFKMSRLDLINPDSGFNQLWLGYIEEFGDSDEVIVVVEGKSNVEVIPVLDVLSDKIARHPDLFQGVLHEIDLSKIKQKGLHYVPQRELEVIRQFALDSSRIVRGDWNLLSTDTMLDSFARRLQTSNDPAALGKTLHELDSFSVSLSGAFAQSPNFGSPWSGLENALLKPQAAVPDVVAAASQGDKSYFIFPTDFGVMGYINQAKRLALRTATGA